MKKSNTNYLLVFVALIFQSVLTLAIHYSFYHEDAFYPVGVVQEGKGIRVDCDQPLVYCDDERA